MQKFFVDKSDIKDNTVLITKAETYQHLIKVLRKRKGDKVIIADGEGNEYSCIIEAIEELSITARITDFNKSAAEPALKVTLYQCLPKLDKMDCIIQKSIELGVGEIVPVLSSRTVVKIKDTSNEEKKTARWRKIAESAAKQCGRGIIPAIKNIVGFEQAAKECAAHKAAIIPYELEEQTQLKQYLTGLQHKCVDSLGILIGPEGGFSSEEIELATNYGIQTVSFGKRILRTETAGCYALGAALFMLE